MITASEVLFSFTLDNLILSKTTRQLTGDADIVANPRKSLRIAGDKSG
jgi:hypothetical protein